MMRLIRRVIYRWGFKPKPGSIFYSPSLSFMDAFRTSKTVYEAFEEGYNKALVDRVFNEKEEDQL